MAKKNTTEETETSTRKPRKPRTLTDLEIEAKAAYEDAKSVGKLMPLVAKLSKTGRAKLNEQLTKIDADFSA